MHRKPEVLAPAGSPDCLPAAVAGGADAVYLGLRHFNARGRAENFRLADLPDQLAYLHAHDVKAYLVLNTLLHDDEFDKAIPMAKQAQQAGIDAVLVQDLGLWHALRNHVPELELHASTQMTVHCRSQIKQLAEIGAARIVLARELSLPELTDLTNYAASLGVETEHFVHGALCYAFSGQCLMSNFSGCRSANRGTCAQNCRFDYQQSEESEFDTHLSMKDLSLIDVIPQMADIGVASLKIEGRLKGPEYVYTVAKAFREAVDAWALKKKLPQQSKEHLDRVFSRGLSSAPIDGVYDQRSRLQRSAEREHGDVEVLHIHRGKAKVLLRSQVEPVVGNGYGFTIGQFRDGFQITSVSPTKKPNEWECGVRISKQGPALEKPVAGVLTSDQGFKQKVAVALRQAPPMQRTRARIALTLSVSGSVGEPLRVQAQTEQCTISCDSALALSAAEKRSLDDAELKKTLGAFGESAYQCVDIQNNVEGAVFIPSKHLKQLRRDIIDALDKQRALLEEEAPQLAISFPVQQAVEKPTKIIVAVSSLVAAQCALQAGADQVWLDDPLLDLWGAQAPKVNLPAGVYLRHPPTRVASPHIASFKGGIVAGHIGVIQAAHAAGLNCIADSYCNVVNSFALEALGRLGVQAAVISLELSAREILRLAGRCVGRALPEQILTVHGRLPSMLTRQDHGLAPGETRLMQAHQRDGGLPYEIQRRLDHDTVIWEARRLVASAAVARTRSVVDAWLLELQDCSPATIESFIAHYQQLRDGDLTAEASIEQLAAESYRQGTFAGHLETGSRALDTWQAQQQD